MSTLRGHRLVVGLSGAFLALVAAGVLIATREQQTRVKPTAIPIFVKKALGTRRPTVELTHQLAAGTKATILPSGFEVSSSAGALSLTQTDGGTAAWTGYANGTSRSTSYGREAIVIGAGKTAGEQYLTVGKNDGLHKWKWQLDAGSLTPTLRPDGSVLVSPAHVVAGFSILPLTIFSTRGKNITPTGLGWGLEHDHGSWYLTLSLDDSRLPAQYVIDPAVESLRAVASANNGGGATTLLIAKPAGLAVNDLMIAQVTVRGGTGEFTCAPAATGAWTDVFTTNNGTTLQQVLYYKVATAADVAATNYTFTFDTTSATCPSPAGVKASGGIAAFYGIDDAAPIDASSARANGSSGTITTNAITNGTTGNFLVGAYGIADGEAVTQPAGTPTFTERWDVGSTGGGANSRTESELSTAVTTAPGSTGAKNATAGTAAVNIGQLITLALDTVAPTNAVTVASVGAGSVYLNGTTLYYNGTSAGTFQLQDAVTETGSGVADVAFPALGGTTTGWTHTTDTQTTPVGGPYVTTNNFAWAGGTSSAPTEIVTATDNATNATPTTLTFTNDSAGPGAFALTAPSNGATIANGQAVSAAPTDGGSGIAQVEFRYCPGVTCSFASGTSIGIDTTSPYSVPWNGQPANGTYTIVARATDNVGNMTDSSTVTVTVSNGAGAASVDGSTVVTTSLASGTTLSWSQTVGSQPNRILLVSASMENSVSCSTTSVTYGGVAMVKIGDTTTTLGNGGGNRDCVSLWYMIDPPTGTATVVATLTPSTTTALAGGGVVIYNVKQTAPDASITSLNESGLSTATLSTTNPNSLVVDTYSSGNTLGDLAPVAPQSLIWSVDGNATESDAMSSKTVAAVGSTTMSWTHTGENRSVMVAAAFSGDTTPPTSALSFNEATNPGGQYELSTGAHAWTYYYNPTTTGTFTMTDAAADASGIAQVEFPDLSTVGFTGTGLQDATSPYNSNTYTFTNANVAAPPVSTVYVDDTFSNTTTEAVTFARDVTAPTAAVTSPAAAGVYNAAGWPGSIAGTAADAGSGVGTVNVSIQDTTVGGNSCWNGASFSVACPNYIAAAGTTSWNYGIAAGSFTNAHNYTATIQTVDNVSSTNNAAATVSWTYDTSAPNAATLSSNGSYNTAGWPGAITGTVSDSGTGNHGISAVNVSIQDSTSGKCWNGANFTTAACPNYIAVTSGGSAVGAANASWSYTLASGALTNGDTYTVQVQATDATTNGNLSGNLAAGTFTYDTSAPNTATLSSNAVYNAAGWPGAITGTTTDLGTGSHGISAVKVSIQDSSSGKCWNGANFTTAVCPNYIAVTSGGSAVGAANANWSYTLASGALTNGDTYTVQVQATDATTSGNVSGNLAAGTFLYDTAAPATATLLSNGTYNAAGWPGAVSGTTTDLGTGSHGISAVNVSIQDSTSGKCWNGANFTTAACP
ncbi:MAG TPA: hypothetical protein VII51_11060, partial [Gaiellaceae bacterium]